MLKKLLLFILLTSCAYHPDTSSYRTQYAHLKEISYSSSDMLETPYFLVILVEARHLDYSSPRSFFKTLAKHPSDGTKNGDVGHAWIYIQGIEDDQVVCVEGGHSGELGTLQPRYMEGLFNQFEQGYENPVSYLWETQHDGFFQQGSGDHFPTFAAKVDLTQDQFNRILKFVEAYNYCDYAITGNQCSSFAAQVAAFAGVDLECEVTLKVDQNFKVGGCHVTLWNDPVYSQITLSTPDILEKSLMEAVSSGKAQYALSWYKKKFRKNRRPFFKEIQLFPSRYWRFKSV